MQLYVINLDRHQQRMSRMGELLDGLPFQRVRAVEGRELDGPETDDSKTGGPVSRYAQACALSHRAAWTEFLKTKARYACVLEDDIFLSEAFPKFIRDESWIPAEMNLLKIETYRQRIVLSRQSRVCLDRSMAALRSRHFGTAGYIVSRQGAEALLKLTGKIQRPVDHLLFGRKAVREQLVRHQLFPALCTQGKFIGNGILFSEMESAIEANQPRPEEPLLSKLRSEIIRPFRQTSKVVSSVITGRYLRERSCVVPFA